MKKSLNVSAVLLLLAYTARAQSFAIDMHTIDGGGGTSTGGVFAVSGTAGQLDAGATMTGGAFSHAGGFWSLFALQMPGAPLLTLALTSTNTVFVSWPVSGLNFQLQENISLALPNSWSRVTQPAVTNGAQISVTVPASVARKFFRLKSS